MNFHTLEPQTSKKGRPFRIISVRKHTGIASRMIDRVERWHWIYKCLFLDTNKTFEVEINHFNKIIRVK